MVSLGKTDTLELPGGHGSVGLCPTQKSPSPSNPSLSGYSLGSCPLQGHERLWWLVSVSFLIRE